MSEPSAAAGPNAAVPQFPEWLRNLERWERIPGEARDALIAAVAEAVDLAGAERAEAGYEILLAGLQRAQEHWNGEPWGRELVLYYQEALDRFGQVSPERGPSGPHRDAAGLRRDAAPPPDFG